VAGRGSNREAPVDTAAAGTVRQRPSSFGGESDVVVIAAPFRGAIDRESTALIDAIAEGRSDPSGGRQERSTSRARSAAFGVIALRGADIRSRRRSRDSAEVRPDVSARTLTVDGVARTAGTKSTASLERQIGGWDLSTLRDRLWGGVCSGRRARWCRRRPSAIGGVIAQELRMVWPGQGFHSPILRPLGVDAVLNGRSEGSAVHPRFLRWPLSAVRSSDGTCRPLGCRPTRNRSVSPHSARGRRPS
jgi:hypothetical protein